MNHLTSAGLLILRIALGGIFFVPAPRKQP